MRVPERHNLLTQSKRLYLSSHGGQISVVHSTAHERRDKAYMDRRVFDIYNTLDFLVLQSFHFVLDTKFYIWGYWVSIIALIYYIFL